MAFPVRHRPDGAGLVPLNAPLVGVAFPQDLAAHILAEHVVDHGPVRLVHGADVVQRVGGADLREALQRVDPAAGTLVPEKGKKGAGL